MAKVKISRHIGVQKNNEEGISFENILIAFDTPTGTEVDVSEKDKKYIEDTMKRFWKVQSMLKEKWNQVG